MPLIPVVPRIWRKVSLAVELNPICICCLITSNGFLIVKEKFVVIIEYLTRAEAISPAAAANKWT